MQSAFMAQGTKWGSYWSNQGAAFLGSVPMVGQAMAPGGGSPMKLPEMPSDRTTRIKPDATRTTTETTRPDFQQRGLLRICGLLQRFAEEAAGSTDESEARSRIFWSYVRNETKRSGQTEDAIAQAVQANCPTITLPPKPPAPRETKPPKEKGFHGKTMLSYDEAKELSELLTVVLTPLSPEEAAREIAREECLRDMVQAEGFPIVERLQERLTTFLATAQPTDTFEISHGEVVVTGKAVECAEAIGRVKTVRTVAYTGGAAAGGLGLLWLLGIL